MKYGLIIFLIVAFLIANIYHDGKYIKLIKSWKKYYQMALVAFLGLSLFVFLKKHPKDGQNMMKHAAQIVKYIPIDRDSADFISPLLNFGTNNPFAQNNAQQANASNISYGSNIPPQQKRMMRSGVGSTKRSVSETKKKFVAAAQSWKCGKCKKQLPAWFEVDHKQSLAHGGSNHVDNLVALCRDCHGEKTALENF
jgi:hypothetical protein